MNASRPNALFQRALILHQQGRHADAERELRQALAMDPHDADAHAMLALCLAERKDFPQAQYEADTAAGLAPDDAFPHYARARVLSDRHRLDEAAAAVQQALDLDAGQGDYFALLAAVRFEQRRWHEALAAAEEGLKVDPDHAGCTNLRAMALVKLGRRNEAGAAIDEALARDPQNAVTHANQGWTLLHRGDPRKALEHFREALRLDPDLEWARAGIVEALKARHFVYRWVLMYFLWMARLSERAQWGILVGGYVGYRILVNVARNSPAVAPYVWPLVIAYIVFVLMSWLADPLFNLLLRLNRFGRLALSREQRVTSNWVALLLLGAAASGAWALWRDDAWSGAAAVACVCLMIPTSSVLKCQPGWPRWTMLAVTIALALLASAAVALHAAGGGVKDAVWTRLANGAFMLFLYGTLAASFASNYLRTVQPQR